MVHRDPLATLARWARDYGDIVHYRFFGLPVYFLVHPRDIEQVLLTRSRSLSKGLVSRSAPELFGNGLLTSDGDFWQRQRRLSNPAFHREKIARYSEITTDEAARLIASWQTGETRNVHQDMMNVTLRIVLRSLFGTGLDGTATRLIERALGDIMQSSSGIHSVAALFLHLPTPARRRYLNAVHKLDGVVFQLIAQGKERLRRGSTDANIPKDLLTMLLLAKDENGSGMRDEQLRDEVITLLLAGHDVLPILSYAVSYLCENSRLARTFAPYNEPHLAT